MVTCQLLCPFQSFHRMRNRVIYTKFRLFLEIYAWKTVQGHMDHILSTYLFIFFLFLGCTEILSLPIVQYINLTQYLPLGFTCFSSLRDWSFVWIICAFIPQTGGDGEVGGQWVAGWEGSWGQELQSTTWATASLQLENRAVWSIFMAITAEQQVKESPLITGWHQEPIQQD